MKTSKLNGAAMAMMVAGLFAVTSMSASAAEKMSSGKTGDTASVKCMNSSSCKGHGACKQASNACKGQNACKGEGFTMQKSQADCDAAQASAKQA